MLCNTIDHPSDTNQTPEYLTEWEAAFLLRCSVRTLQRGRWEKKGPPYVKLPGRGGKGRILYHRETLRAWINNRTVITLDVVAQR